MAFSDRLKRDLERKGLSIRELGRRLGLSPGHVNRVVNGLEPFPIRLIDDLFNILGYGEHRRHAVRLEILLTHCPEEIVEEFMKMRRRLEMKDLE